MHLAAFYSHLAFIFYSSVMLRCKSDIRQKTVNSNLIVAYFCINLVVINMFLENLKLQHAKLKC